MKIDWRMKLSSRKFQSAVVGVVSALLYTFKVAETDITQILGLVTSCLVLISYIVVEGNIDAKREGADVYVIEDKMEDEVE